MNTADQLVEALTHGPLPEGPDWEIIESGYNDANEAWAILKVDGVEFNLVVSAVKIPAA